MWTLLLNKYVLGLVGALAICAGLAYGWYRFTEHYIDQGRAEVQATFDQYKADAATAAKIATAANEALSVKNAALSAQLAKRLTTSFDSLNKATQNAQTIIASASVPDCALPSGVLDAVNAVRAGAAAEISGAYNSQRTVQ